MKPQVNNCFDAKMLVNLSRLGYKVLDCPRRCGVSHFNIVEVAQYITQCKEVFGLNDKDTAFMNNVIAEIACNKRQS